MFERLLMDEPHKEYDLLTTDQGKMYSIYILYKDGEHTRVEIFDDSVKTEIEWFDHCINPRSFAELAVELNCKFTEQTWLYIIEEFEDNYLGRDYTGVLTDEQKSHMITEQED